ncbi:MAG: aldo/keto reductase [Planctomycetota bacterium]
MSDSVAWGVLGAGAIAKAFAHGVTETNLANLAAVGSRSADKAQALIDELGLTGATAHGSYDDLIADDSVDAVYIATPHPMHARWAIRAAEAGKHVFCEKPLGVNQPEAMAMVQAARENNVFLMEAFKDRCHPQTARLLELIREGTIGEVRFIEVSFGFGGGTDIGDPDGRLFNPALAGGAIMDVGCYAAEFARLIAGVAVGEPFADPVEVKGVGHLGETGVDEWAGASLRFASGIVAQIGTAIRAPLDNTCTVYGSAGSILLPDPWLNDRDKAAPGKILVKVGGETTTHEIPAEHSAFGHEVHAASRAILDGKTESDAMTWDDSLGQALILDAWRKEIGLTYPVETPEGFPAPLSGHPPARREDAAMTYGRIPGLDREVSKLVMGCDNQRSFAHAAVMFDDWFARGGNTFDTAHIYAGGRQERYLGDWLRTRGVRDRVNLISKGAHTPNCNPEALTRQFHESLDRLQTDRADIYIMHRDNLDVPVGEFVDVLSEHVDAGRITVFGGSNWSVERFAEANAYAEKNGKHKFTLMSNNFSLARMVNPVWDGCVAATIPETRQYLIDHQVPNLAWSSQARGYFVSRDGAGNDVWRQGDAWESPDNRERRDRAFELAEKRGVTAINIAAAYVLCQPFPSFALIGPRAINETATSLPALGLTLTEDEMAYLDLRD